jgi:hypothetical protein
MRARTEEPLHLTAVAWARSRAFVGDIRGGLHALSGGALHEVLSFDAPIVDLETDGDMLYITTAEGGIGPTNSYLVAYDVASAGLVWDRSFEDHALGDMSIAGGRIWAAEFGDFRLLELTLGGERLATRYLSGGTLPRFALDQVAASDTRVVIASAEDSERRVLEYRKGVEGFATLPSAQYAVPGPCTALCLLGAWGLAAGVGDHVILIPGEEAQPLGTGR